MTVRNIGFCVLLIIAFCLTFSPAFTDDGSRKSPPVVACPRTFNPPTIDGRLTDRAWRTAQTIDGFLWHDGIEKPFAQTHVYLTWDDRYFYLAVKCDEPNISMMKISKARRDDHVWQDDSVEFLIDPDPSTKEYYQLIVNPIGFVMDQIVQAEPYRERAWDPHVLLGNMITEGFWTSELAIPFNEMGTSPRAGDRMRMNIHRKLYRRDEFTYWSPTYDRNPMWPHVPDRFGFVELVSREPDESKMHQINSIRIDRTTQIVPEELILEILDLKAGDLISDEEVAQIGSSLELTGLFTEASAAMEEGGVLVVRFREKELTFVKDVVIHLTGDETAVLLNAEEIKRRFGLSRGFIPTKEIGDKCTLIENFYRANWREIDLRWDLKDGIVTIELNVRRRPMRRPPQRGDIGRRVPKSLLALNVTNDDIAFSRVRGLIFGAGFDVSKSNPTVGARIFGDLTYGYSSKDWNSMIGVESWLFRRRMAFRFDYHDITQIRDESIMPHTSEDFLASFVLGENFRDYYGRKGYEIGVIQRIRRGISLGVKFRDDDHRSLEKKTDWSLFRNDKVKRENLPASEGDLRSVQFTIRFDTRNERSFARRQFSLIPVPNNKTTSGMMGQVSLEYAKENLGGSLNEKFDFIVARFELSSYNRLSETHFFNIRLKAGFADNTLPMQYKFHLGGLGTLRGFDFQEFKNGDRMVLMNAEYRVNTRILSPILFIDTGYVWAKGDEITLSDLKTSVGVGLQIMDRLWINIAKPIDYEPDDSIKLTLRLNRMF